MNITKLSDKAMLVKLAIRRAPLVKRNDALTAQLQQSEGDSSLTVTSKLFRKVNSPVWKIIQATNEAYATHVRLTSPYEDRGARLLPSQTYFDYTQEIRGKIAAVDALKQQYMPGYAQWVADDIAYRSFGKAVQASPSEYPTQAAFDKGTSLTLTFRPLPDEYHPLFDLSDEDRKSFEDSIDQAKTRAQNDVVQRMLAPIGHLVERLSEYKGEKGERFHTSLITNIVEGCQLARRLAIDPPQGLIDEIHNLERIATGYTFNIETIKGDEATRDAMTLTLEEAKRKMEEYFQ